MATCSDSLSHSDSLSRSDSLTTLPYSDDTDEDEDDIDANLVGYDVIRNKRGHKVEYSFADKVAVNIPLMELLDARLLAPIRSSLFAFEQKKDGRGEYKRFQTLVFYEFKRIIKPTIRRLVTRARVTNGNHTTNLMSRYFWVAYDLVRKRRANHIQNWRKYKCPKDLVYGGRNEYIQRFGDPWTNNPKYLASKSKRKRRKRKLTFAVASSTTITKPVPAAAASTTITRHVPAATAVASTTTITKPVPAAAAAAASTTTITKPVPAAAAAASTTTITKPVPTAAGDRDPFHADPFADVQFTCAGCGNNFAKQYAFPKSHSEWATEPNELRCQSCFDEMTKSEYLPQVNLEVSQEEERRGKVQKRKRPCKCGATTHSMRTSKLCPLNKRYNRAEADRDAVRKRVMAGAAARKKRAKVVAAAAAKSPAVVSTTPPPPPAVATTAVVSTTPPSPPAVVTTTPPSPPSKRYEVGDNVYAEWRRGQWFLGQVIAYDDGQYNVYFLFGKVKKKMTATSLRESDSRYPTRTEMIGKTFFFDGAADLAEGEWKIRQLMSAKNQYRCTRLTGTGANVENFDIGYCIKQYMQESDARRESGWAPVLESRTRGQQSK